MTESCLTEEIIGEKKWNLNSCALKLLDYVGIVMSEVGKHTLKITWKKNSFWTILKVC